jgi:hypothetical protein
MLLSAVRRDGPEPCVKLRIQSAKPPPRQQQSEGPSVGALLQALGPCPGVWHLELKNIVGVRCVRCVCGRGLPCSVRTKFMLPQGHLPWGFQGVTQVPQQPALRFERIWHLAH